MLSSFPSIYMYILSYFWKVRRRLSWFPEDTSRKQVLEHLGASFSTVVQSLTGLHKLVSSSCLGTPETAPGPNHYSTEQLHMFFPPYPHKYCLTWPEELRPSGHPTMQGSLPLCPPSIRLIMLGNLNGYKPSPGVEEVWWAVKLPNLGVDIWEPWGAVSFVWFGSE